MSGVEDPIQARVRSIDAESEERVWVSGDGGFVGLAWSPGHVWEALNCSAQQL